MKEPGQDRHVRLRKEKLSLCRDAIHAGWLAGTATASHLLHQAIPFETGELRPDRGTGEVEPDGELIHSLGAAAKQLEEPPGRSLFGAIHQPSHDEPPSKHRLS